MEKKKYAAFSIPRREAQPAEGKPTHKQIGFLEIDLSTDVPFAEIEYEPSVRSGIPAAPARPIVPRAVDPVREKFFAMRSLASGISFARNDPGLFYRQAKFMEDFADDYPVSARFFMYYPCYQHMGYDQLRTYFTWRTRARSGMLLPIPLSNIFVYIYELLAGIGVKDPAEGLEKLLAVWNTYREREHALDTYLPGWIKDYHVFYALPHSFEDFVSRHGLQGYYPDLFLYDQTDSESCFKLWNRQSSYNADKSKFYGDGNAVLMQDCFAAVLDGIAALCGSQGHRIEDLWTDSIRRGIPWYPFRKALFFPWTEQHEREVILPGGEAYHCEDDRWAADIPILYPNRRELAGYLLKKTEACLRQAVKYKYKITAAPGSFGNFSVKLRQLNITQAQLDAAIEKAVDDFHRNLTRTVVVVNTENLSRIREEALSTQDKLIVPEEETPSAPAMAPAEQNEPAAQGPQAELENPETEGWAALKAALSATEATAVSIILSGRQDMKAFADESGVMLEVLIDSINEKAADHIGDSIIDFTDSIIIYDEYREKIKEMMG